MERNQLTPDVVFIDTLLPALPLRRAMAGGLKIEFNRPIRPDDLLIATRTMTNNYEKQGSQGPQIFYEVTMQVDNESGKPVLTVTATRIMR